MPADPTPKPDAVRGMTPTPHDCGPSAAGYEWFQTIGADCDPYDCMMDDEDCGGPLAGVEPGPRAPLPIASPEGVAFAYEAKYVVAIRSRWPDVVLSFTGRGAWRRLRVSWPEDGAFVVLNLAELRPVHEIAAGFTASGSKQPRWSGRAGPMNLVAYLADALDAHREPFLLWLPPDVGAWRDPSGEALYGESLVGDPDSVTLLPPEPWATSPRWQGAQLGAPWDPREPRRQFPQPAPWAGAKDCASEASP